MKSSIQLSPREVGVDVSKDRLDVFDGKSHWQVPNTKAGIRRLLGRLRKTIPLEKTRLTCEATGRYGHLLVAMALEAGLPVTLANPRAVRDFSRASGRLAKTDRIDAATIAAYATAIHPPVLDQAWRGHQRFLEIHSRMRSLIALAASQKAALCQHQNHEITREIRGVIALLERRIRVYERALLALVQDSPTMRQRCAKMRAIKCVGPRTALALLATMPELGRLNRQQAAALAGLAPMNRDSGTLRGKRCIQGGRAAARTALYRAALPATRFHPTLAPFYKHLRDAGKSARVALCAVARKLLTQINSALKTTPLEI